MNEDEKHFYKRDWSLEDWKTSEDRLDREVWFAVIQSPHNLWKVRVSLETLVIQAKEGGKREAYANVAEQLKDATVRNIGLPNGNTVLVEMTKDFISNLSPNKSDGGGI